jgi:hypothetical protein
VARKVSCWKYQLLKVNYRKKYSTDLYFLILRNRKIRPLSLYAVHCLHWWTYWIRNKAFCFPHFYLEQVIPCRLFCSGLVFRQYRSILASRLWVHRGFGLVYIPMLVHKGVFGLVLQLWTREVVLLRLQCSVSACCSEIRCFWKYSPTTCPYIPLTRRKEAM